MISMIPWRFVAFGVVLLAIVSSVLWTQHTIASLRRENSSLKVGLADANAAAEANALAAEKIRRASEKSLQAVSKSLEEVRASRLRAEKQRKVLRNVPATPDEDRLSAVLTAALGCLRNPEICAAKDSVGSAGDPASPNVTSGVPRHSK